MDAGSLPEDVRETQRKLAILSVSLSLPVQHLHVESGRVPALSMQDWEQPVVSIDGFFLYRLAPIEMGKDGLAHQSEGLMQS